MNTPICDFVKKYADSGTLRLHMPGHKGESVLGCEAYDITEIGGADSLYEANGIIAESERNASALFGARTFYSTEGSSLSIRAMLYLTLLYAKEKGERALVLAARNAHKSFLSALALLDIDVEWLSSDSPYLSFLPDADELEQIFLANRPTALYLTSPDYLGNISDISELSRVCRKHGALLLVDNAHGAYLRFLSPSRHPIDLGADMCADSAHKTLPVLTGGAYLHISKDAPALFSERAKDALALFGSTSPSYLILQSLDAANKILSDGFSEKIAELAHTLEGAKARLCASGYDITGDEPIKLTLMPKSYGYTGEELADILREKGIECEFADPDYIVFMLTPAIKKEDIERLVGLLLSVERKERNTTAPPKTALPKRVMSVREAMLSHAEILPVHECLGRVLASPNVACPPAVPIVMCGEIIDRAAIEMFDYYGIKTCKVTPGKTSVGKTF